MTNVKGCSSRSPVGALVRGLLSGAVGVAAMDLLSYYRHRRGGGENGPIEWEFSVGLED